MRDLRVFVFEAFLKSSMQLQTTRSPRLLNRFECFWMQNEEEVLLVSFLFSTLHFYWVGNDENFVSSKKTEFLSSFFTNVIYLAISGYPTKNMKKQGNNGGKCLEMFFSSKRSSRNYTHQILANSESGNPVRTPNLRTDTLTPDAWDRDPNLIHPPWKH